MEFWEIVKTILSFIMLLIMAGTFFFMVAFVIHFQILFAVGCFVALIVEWFIKGALDS